ncbi:MAG: GNAT family N-acetyltransferase [Candidatus Heimdallarchaeota archaeon]|nr:GNAT family N-acetyltransferase [Candidatus Heimdallarchaeota archaeon]
MLEDFDSILEVGQKRVTRLAYSIWDIITFPEAVHFEESNSSFRFSYDLHTTLFGPPSKELLEKFNPKGTISLSFDLEWLELVLENFSDFEVMDKAAEDKKMNTFLCMELIQKDFKSKDTYDSQILNGDLIKNLSFKRRLLFSNSEGGGVGIIKNDEMVGVAFAPHIVSNDLFSFAVIRGVWVSETHRNKGYGYDVSAKMCEELFSNDIEKVTLWVEESNFPAVRIYEKMGFRTVEEVYGTDCIKLQK